MSFHSCGIWKSLSTTTIAFVQKQLEIGSVETIVDWNNYLGKVCAQKLLENPVKIGGEGKTVKIDESVFARRKYNRGRKCKEQWVLFCSPPTTKIFENNFP